MSKKPVTVGESGKHDDSTMDHKKGEETLRCRIMAYNFSPKGEIEGLQVEASERPAQVVFPHDTGTEAAQAISIGQTIDLVVEAASHSSKGEASHPVYRFVSTMSNDKSVRQGTPSPGAIKGIVARLNFARHGEANGVILENGDFIHMKPDGMRQVELKIGDPIEAEGKGRPMEFGGRVVEATTVNGVRLKGKH